MSSALLWERDRGSWPNSGASRFVTAAGIRWHVQQMGSGPALLLVHGTGASTHSWRDVLAPLAAHHTVIAMDLPGHGFTDSVPPPRCSLPGMSASLAALLDQLQVSPTVWVGHSAGAAILCQMALERKVAAPGEIISLNGALQPFSGAAGLLFAPIARFLAASGVVPGLVARRARDRRAVARLIAGTGSVLDERGIDLYARLVRDPRHVAGALNMMANWNLRDFAAALPGLGIPLRLIAASEDRTVPPAQAVNVAMQVPGARLVSWPGLGHLAHEEQPALLVRALDDVRAGR
jgi:magnesium chelatase accessory protein